MPFRIGKESNENVSDDGKEAKDDGMKIGECLTKTRTMKSRWNGLRKELDSLQEVLQQCVTRP